MFYSVKSLDVLLPRTSPDQSELLTYCVELSRRRKSRLGNNRNRHSWVLTV